MRRILKKAGEGEEGFTLLELLVVVALMAVMMAVVMPNFLGVIATGKTEANATELRGVQTVVDAYLAENRTSTLGGPDTITPVNYSTGTFKDYFRSSPSCSYNIDVYGKVVQAGCQ
ncbi:MAG: ral secretion family protein [Dehalococcoidia bacterium]|nr:ral secretion family protein [Dehalococcoidia bacterium]